MEAPILKVTKFDGRKDNRTDQVRAMSWHQFVHYLKQRRVAPYKWGESPQNENAPLFSPVEYAQDLQGFAFAEWWEKKIDGELRRVGKFWKSPAGEKRKTTLEDRIVRANENVLGVHLAVLDYDSHPEEVKHGKTVPAVVIPVEPIVEKMKELGVNFAVYSSHQSTKEYPRFRLVIPFQAPLIVADFKAAWPFGFEQMDDSCKDLARMFLMPSVDPKFEGEAFFYAETEKKYFSPKIPLGAAKKAKKKRYPRGDYETLDAVTWFDIHGCKPAQVEPFKYTVDCPWSAQHTGGYQGPTDTVLWVERGPGKWPTFSCSHSTCKAAGRDIEAVMKLWGDQDEYCARALDPKTVKTGIQIKALGHDDTGKYYYQCNQTNHLVALKAREHNEREFYSITSKLQHWLKYADPETGKIDWKAAARDLIGQCHDRGFFKPDMLRGGGVWLDDGRLVVHLGKELLVDGERTNIFDLKSDYVYEAMVKDVDLPDPVSRDQAKKVFNLISNLPFKYNGHNALLAGGIVCGYLSGILKWRPHLWITGEQGGGKTQILQYVLSPLWKPMGGIHAEGVSTEAGLRQVRIRHNAVPVIVDESESNDRREIDRVAGIVRLARSSSSDSSADVVKGNSAATGHTYTVRSCFVLCSIVENLEHEQDKERFTVLEVVKSERSKKNWSGLRAELVDTFTKEFALGLYAWSLDNISLIKANQDTFHQALMRNMPKVEPRWCDQYGALLGAAYTMGFGEQITHDQAWTFFQSLSGIKELAERSESSIPKRALAVLLAHIPLGQSKNLGEMVNSVMVGMAPGGDAWGDRDAAEAALARYGLRVHEGYLHVSSNHPSTEKIMKDAGYPGHYNLLARLEGAVKGIPMRFGPAHVSKSVRIPLPKLEDERTQNGKPGNNSAESVPDLAF